MADEALKAKMQDSTRIKVTVTSPTSEIPEEENSPRLAPEVEDMDASPAGRDSKVEEMAQEVIEVDHDTKSARKVKIEIAKLDAEQKASLDKDPSQSSLVNVGEVNSPS